MTPRTHAKWVIRTTPVENPKFASVWRRVRTKIKLRRALGQLSTELQLFGTSTTANIDDEGLQKDIEALINRKV
jgi:hypothetical protein